jgi:hypothetical protein
LILGYVTFLADNKQLGDEDLELVQRLKLSLGVTEGEFVALRPVELATLLAAQLQRVLEDGSIDSAEDLQQVHLLLQSGKLTTKKMPVARTYELYQDYVRGGCPPYWKRIVRLATA